MRPRKMSSKDTRRLPASGQSVDDCANRPLRNANETPETSLSVIVMARAIGGGTHEQSRGAVGTRRPLPSAGGGLCGPNGRRKAAAIGAGLSPTGEPVIAGRFTLGHAGYGTGAARASHTTIGPRDEPRLSRPFRRAYGIGSTSYLSVGNACEGPSGLDPGVLRKSRRQARRGFRFSAPSAARRRPRRGIRVPQLFRNPDTHDSSR